MMRAARYAVFSVLCAIGASVFVSQASSGAGGGARLKKRELIGAWRLVRIDYSGPSGPMIDPFYQADSIGTIIYDPSGWMSVQIAAPHRQPVAVPESRSPGSAAMPDAHLKAAAFDSYYAYFGTWDFDAAHSLVTHHLESSLIPSETGMDYAQTVSLEGGRLVFTTHGGKKGAETVRRKIWERATGIRR